MEDAIKTGESLLLALARTPEDLPGATPLRALRGLARPVSTVCSCRRGWSGNASPVGPLSGQNLSPLLLPEPLAEVLHELPYLVKPSPNSLPSMERSAPHWLAAKWLQELPLWIRSLVPRENVDFSTLERTEGPWEEAYEVSA